jgi:hypothetical protein
MSNPLDGHATKIGDRTARRAFYSPSCTEFFFPPNADVRHATIAPSQAHELNKRIGTHELLELCPTRKILLPCDRVRPTFRAAVFQPERFNAGLTMSMLAMRN